MCSSQNHAASQLPEPRGSAHPAAFQSESWMPLVMAQHQKMHEALTFLEKEMVWKRRQGGPPQSIIHKMKHPRISCDFCDDGFCLREKTITQIAAALRIIKRQRGPQVSFDLLVEDDAHHLPAKITADFLPSATHRRILREFTRTAAGFGGSIVLINQHRGKRTKQIRRQARPVSVRQVHRAFLNFFQLHAGTFPEAFVAVKFRKRLPKSPSQNRGNWAIPLAVTHFATFPAA